MQSMYVSTFPSDGQNLRQRVLAFLPTQETLAGTHTTNSQCTLRYKVSSVLIMSTAERLTRLGVAYDWTDMSNYPNDQFPPNPEIPMIPASNSPLPFNTRQRDGRQNLLILQDQQARSISPGHQMGSLGQQSSFGGRGDMSFSSGSLPVPSHESNLRGPYAVGMIPTSMQTPPGQYISS